MRQFTEEMTPVKILDRGAHEKLDMHWRLCTVGDDDTRRYTVTIAGAVARSLEKHPHDYDVDDIAVLFVEMAFEQGHQAGDFAVEADSTEYAHLVAYIQKSG